MPLLFTAAIFLSAFLLFLVQPMITKIIMPQLGGAPAVWITSMLFFQIALLAGYIYAHSAPRWLGARRHAAFHVALMAASFVLLPLSVRELFEIPPSEAPLLWQLSTLLATIGLPFFVLAANAPLLQEWFRRSNHHHAENPYFLYSASNAGSFLALLAYPFIIEPSLTLPSQEMLWSIGYGAFSAVLLACGWVLLKSNNVQTSDTAAASAQPISWRTRGWWTALAFAPSSLMLGLTLYASTDIASFPLLWIVPLAVYLLTFVVAFSGQDRITAAAIRLQPLMLIVLLVFTFSPSLSVERLLLLHFIIFAIVAMACHGQLARAKPPAENLTAFYVWISVGGALGGIFNAVIAPQLFSSVIEYPLVLALAYMLRPAPPKVAGASRWVLWRPVLFALPLCALVLAYMLWGDAFWQSLWKAGEKKTVLGMEFNAPRLANTLLMVVCCFGAFALRESRLAFTLVLLTLTFYFHHKPDDRVLSQVRNYFGVHKVSRSADGSHHTYTHGTTTHGMQPTDDKDRLKVTSYYRYLIEMRGALAPAVAQLPMAAIGMGVGTSACVASQDQVFHFYDIDPDVVAMARNPKFFTYLRDCPARIDVILGDGRLKISEAPDGFYGMIILDAYSSDSLPIHLMTLEALDIYMSKLAPGGVLAFHISNRHLDLEYVIAKLAHARSLIPIMKAFSPQEKWDYPAQWMLVGREIADFKPIFNETSGWRLQTEKDVKAYPAPPWTDHYSNILEVLR